MSVTIDAPAEALRAKSSRTFFGHPTGLGYIVFTEGWERFSFHGMQALLVLYMVNHLLLPGSVEHVAGFAGFRSALEAVFGTLSVQALASQIFGLYVGLVYFFPMLGGLLGDHVLGRTRAVVVGAVLMAAGHFLMAFEVAFLFALLLLIAGAGVMKGNLGAQVGALYERTDVRRDTAYSLYSLAINVGAFFAPLVCGTLGEVYGWHYGFGAAGVGMLIATMIYIAGRRNLPPDEIVARAKTGAKTDAKLQAGEWRIVVTLAAVIAVTALYWTAQSQVWNVYPLWLQAHVDRQIGGLTVPVTWFQSLDTFAVLAMAPLLIAMWKRQTHGDAESRDISKIATGCVAFLSGCVLLAIADAHAGTAAVALPWAVIFHFTGALGYLYVWPNTMALVSRAAPPAVNAMMVGACYLAIFAGGVFSGWLGRFYEQMSGAHFWLLHAVVSGLGAVAILLLRKPLLRGLQAHTQRS